jgi:Flp pilus assembly protein CpaB
VTEWERLTRRLRRAYLRFRRPLAALLAGAAVLAVTRIVSPSPAASVPIVVAAHDLISGVELTATDVRVARVPPQLAPSNSYAAADTVLGDVVAAPMRAGEPMTDRRLLGRSLIAGYGPGMVAAPVRIQDSDVAALLHTGSSIDLYAATSTQGPADLVVGAAPVVLVPRIAADSQTGALVVLAVTPADAARLAAASATAPLSVTLRS